MSKRLILALCWSLTVAALIGHNFYLFACKGVTPDTDILALLPAENRDPVLQSAFRKMVETSEQRIVVLIGSENWNDAMKAADAYENSISRHSDLLYLSIPAPAAAENEWLPLFSKYRYQILTDKQRDALESRPKEYWLETALARLYSPFGAPQFLGWQTDPFGLFNDWAQERIQETPVRLRDGKLFVSGDRFQYVVLPVTIRKSAFSFDAQQAILPVLETARTKAENTAAPVRILSAGVLLHAASASKHAQQEITTIGIGSLLGITLLIWLTFRSIRPVFLIGLSLLTGVSGALSICYLIYGQIHVLTLVFGASLIGIAQDYGIYYLCNRIHTDKKTDSWTLTKHLLPGMSLTLSTTVIAYLGLSLAPFPGLRQMALFAASGLIFAWLTVICWFPWLAPANAFKNGNSWFRYRKSIHYWPTASLNKTGILLLALFFFTVLWGISRLSVNDDLRVLQNPDIDLLNQQNEIGSLLDIPAMTQFYLIKGKNEQDVLEKEEQLKQKLKPLIEGNRIRGYQAVSNWIPSIKKQTADYKLIRSKLYEASGAYTILKSYTGLQNHLPVESLNNDKFLTIDQFLSINNNDTLKHLWLGKNGNIHASIVTIRGLSRDAIPALRQLQDESGGILWIDKVDEISSVLSRYREHMGWIVLSAYFAIWLILLIRYRKQAWKIVMPPLLASLATLAVMGIIGKEVNLFNTLAFMLILGIGVDSGIFLQEQASDDPETVWLEIGLSASSTLLSFGLLCLSTTPALHSFGLTMLIGISLVWIIVPFFRKKS